MPTMCGVIENYSVEFTIPIYNAKRASGSNRVGNIASIRSVSLCANGIRVLAHFGINLCSAAGQMGVSKSQRLHPKLNSNHYAAPKPRRGDGNYGL